MLFYSHIISPKVWSALMHRIIKLGVVGSRDFSSRYLVERVVYELPKHVVIVTGGARGVDKWAEDTAKYHNRDVIVHEAQWNKYGKTAGFIRNNVIVRDSDLILAFWDGKSPGTRHTIQLSKSLSKPCIIVRMRNNDS